MVKAVFIALLAFLCTHPAQAAEFKYSGPQTSSIGDDQVEGKDPLLATVFSVLPGMVFHGFGNFYAGDYEMGSRLLVTEIVGITTAVWGHHVIHQESDWTQYFGEHTPQAGYWIKLAGVSLICISWIADITTAHEAADSYNKDHQIQFQLEGRLDGMQLALTKRF